MDGSNQGNLSREWDMGTGFSPEFESGCPKCAIEPAKISKV